MAELTHLFMDMENAVRYIIPLLQDENDKQSVTLRYQQFQEIPLSKNTLLRESTVDNME